jgi:hypothetical protein
MMTKHVIILWRTFNYEYFEEKKTRKPTVHFGEKNDELVVKIIETQVEEFPQCRKF